MLTKQILNVNFGRKVSRGFAFKQSLKCFEAFYFGAIYFTMTLFDFEQQKIVHQKSASQTKLKPLVVIVLKYGIVFYCITMEMFQCACRCRSLSFIFCY